MAGIFKITPDPTFTSSVPMPLPGGDVVEIEVEFVYVAPESFDEFRAMRAEQSLNETLAEIIRAWKGPVDDKGKPVAFSPAALALMLNKHHAAADVLFRAWVRGLRGERLKN